ncbi:MAG: immunoglobulin-like domain-containing protein [Lentisphaerota bacterium]
MALRADGTVVAWGDHSDVPDGTYQLYNYAFTTNGVVDTNAVGSYSRTYTVKNTLSTSTVTRAVEVVDTTAPVLTLLGTNLTIIAVGTPYIDPGATALDACGGDFTAGIVTNGLVDFNVGGAYTQTYSAVDSYNNTGRIQRAVWIADIPSIDNLSNLFVLAHTVPGTHGARFYADVTVKGTAVGAWFEYGVSTNYSNTGPTLPLAAGCYTSNRVLSVSNLPYGVIYHWRVVATSGMGNVVSPDQVAEWAAGAPVINGLTAYCTTTNAFTGTRGAGFQAVVNPNGPESTAFFQFGLDPDYLESYLMTNTLPAGYVNSNLVFSMSSLAFGATYHWRIVATNMLGETMSGDQVLEIPSPYARGDFNGNGIVEDFELDWVYGGYWQDNPTVITNALELGQTEVELAVDSLIGWDLTAQYSDDLMTWSNLSGRAVPVFQFTDPNATNHPARAYRLLAP